MYSLLLPTQSTTVISRQLSNIPTHGLLSKCKNTLILLTDQSKSPKKNDKSIELELFSCIFPYGLKGYDFIRKIIPLNCS